jgi:predicted amidophosphoribosyltransferase
MDQNYWRNCIVCKSEINFSTKYYKCSVSSCDKKRSPAQFCSVDCWDVHRSIMSHKSAGADEYQSPLKQKWLDEQADAPKVRIVSNKSATQSASLGTASDQDILVVVSKLKSYIKDRSGFNTSADVMPELSNIIRKVCDEAIVNAQKSERKTLMARDF